MKKQMPIEIEIPNRKKIDKYKKDLSKWMKSLLFQSLEEGTKQITDWSKKHYKDLFVSCFFTDNNHFQAFLNTGQGKNVLSVLVEIENKELK